MRKQLFRAAAALIIICSLLTVTCLAAAPVITKDPVAETVNEGDPAIFIAHANSAAGLYWKFDSPDGTETVHASAAEEKFPGLKLFDIDTDSIILTEIPASLSGWKISCVFVNTDGEVSTKGAVITVNPRPAGSEGTNPGEETPVTPDTDPLPTEEEVHNHTLTGSWVFNEMSHWQECTECNAHTNESFHTYSWVTLDEASDSEDGVQLGTCEICGYMTTMRIPAQRSSGTGRSTLRYALIGGISIMAACGLYVILRRRNEE